MTHISKPVLLALTLALSACSSLNDKTIDYRSSAKPPALEVPPDLTQLTRETRYALPGEAVSASGFRSGQGTGAQQATASLGAGDVRVEGYGQLRWLVVDRPAEQLWPQVKNFWLTHGFVLVMDETQLGIMETDWAEDRAKLPQDFLRATLGRVFDSLYSTGERDKFRTRLERTADGKTEIFISHRGMVEVYENPEREQKTSTIWQPRPADHGLEVELLRRLMLKLGLPEDKAGELLATSPPESLARVATVDGQAVVHVAEGFARAWRRVGLALDRTGFTIEDRDRSQGLYFVRYVPPANPEAKPGFFARLFGATPEKREPLKYRIAVKALGEASTVSVLDAQGVPQNSATAQQILKLIAQDMK